MRQYFSKKRAQRFIFGHDYLVIDGLLKSSREILECDFGVFLKHSSQAPLCCGVAIELYRKIAQQLPEESKFICGQVNCESSHVNGHCNWLSDTVGESKYVGEFRISDEYITFDFFSPSVLDLSFDRYHHDISPFVSGRQSR